MRRKKEKAEAGIAGLDQCQKFVTLTKRCALPHLDVLLLQLLADLVQCLNSSCVNVGGCGEVKEQVLTKGRRQ